MSNTQLSRAMDAAYDAMKALRDVCAEVIDHRDARIENIDHALDRLAEILYVEKDE